MKYTMQPHLKIKKGDITPVVLMPGDPARVEVIGRKLTNFKILGQNREFSIGKGKYKGIPITVCSTGIGGPSTAIAVEELIKGGAKTLIRVGTCGGAWRQDIPLGSLIIPTSSVRDEGTTKEYVRPDFPAVADFNIVTALARAASDQKKKYFVGINRTHDAFYAPAESKARWKNLPIISSDMETSVIFVISLLRGVRAGAILAVNANPEPINKGVTKTVAEETARATQKVVNEMIDVALRAVEILVQNKHHNQSF